VADYTKSKSGPGVLFPTNALESSWIKVEPLVTPEQIRSRHLFGIPLVSGMKDPLTGKSQVYTDDLIKDTIDRAVAIVEAETHLDIFPVQHQEKHPFDRQEYQSFGYFRVRHRPVSSVQKLAITPPSGQELYIVPNEWIETGYLVHGQINLIPLGNAIAYGNVAQVGSGGALFLNVFGQQPWTPAFWAITYTSGFPDGMIPKILNELIGVVAAMEVLGALAATYAKSNSHSLGIDGLSQSISTPGPQLFAQRMQELGEKRRMLSKKLKALYGQTIFSGNV
jgi:hypothetical protein